MSDDRKAISQALCNVGINYGPDGLRGVRCFYQSTGNTLPGVSEKDWAAYIWIADSMEADRPKIGAAANGAELVQAGAAETEIRLERDRAIQERDFAWQIAQDRAAYRDALWNELTKLKAHWDATMEKHFNLSKGTPDA